MERVGLEPTTRRVVVDNPDASALSEQGMRQDVFPALPTELPPHTLIFTPEKKEVLEESAGFEPAERQFSSLATKRNKPNSATIPDLLESRSSIGESGGI